MKKFKSILLIDDDLATNEFHRIILNHADVTESISTVFSGQEAIDYLTCSGDYKSEGTNYPQPDLILLDINMPGMNGFEFIEKYKEIKEKQKGKNIVVMLTSSINPEDKEKALKIEEISDFKSKPLSIAIAKELVNQYL